MQLAGIKGSAANIEASDTAEAPCKGPITNCGSGCIVVAHQCLLYVFRYVCIFLCFLLQKYLSQLAEVSLSGVL